MPEHNFSKPSVHSLQCYIENKCVHFSRELFEYFQNEFLIKFLLTDTFKERIIQKYFTNKEVKCLHFPREFLNFFINDFTSLFMKQYDAFSHSYEYILLLYTSCF